MFDKVLIVEDQQSFNLSVKKTLEEMGMPHAHYAYYCDDALRQIKYALKVNDPYDLLITDLHFEEDERLQQLNGGAALVKAVKAIQPGIKILVFSAESKLAVIDHLLKELDIHAYVRKARRDVDELKKALAAIYQNRKYLSTGLRHSIRETNAYDFSDYDIVLIRLLSQGVLQKDIPFHLEKMQLKPSGLSSVEKRLNNMREALDFTKNEQLIAMCKDMGVI